MNAMQCRLARAELELSCAELARMANVSATTIWRFENGRFLKEETIEAISLALEAVGIEFAKSSRPRIRRAIDAGGEPSIIEATEGLPRKNTTSRQRVEHWTNVARAIRDRSRSRPTG